ncbi:MAG: DnaJ domain-containing protein [Cyanobacteria bacterium]|nr:DnaJ domain-containing protein [Cyanobacteriota bacterium]MDW8200303.1 DnaJ domain-containing protein [Cyanobacteriota bacterium SKYGB_h_bin112]
MPIQVERGLFKVDFFDHHAILGVGIDAEVKEIRKRYLKIARLLHPDSLLQASDAEKQQANEFLSKLVNPAYKKLSDEKERTEYAALLRLMGQKVSRKGEFGDLGEPAQQLMKASDYEAAYLAAVNQLADTLYTSMDKVVDTIGTISELNLAYLIRKHGGGASSTAKPAASTSTTSLKSTAPATSAPTSASASAPSSTTGFTQRLSPAEQCYKRAEGYLKAENQAKAILELRDAIKMEPNNAKCHSMLGTIYLSQNQITMARIHFNKALEIEPHNEEALKGKKQLDKVAAGKATAASPKSAPKSAPPNKGGGLFGGLFGGGNKKK